MIIKIFLPILLLALCSINASPVVNSTTVLNSSSNDSIDCSKCQKLSFDLRVLYDLRKCTPIKKPGCDDCIISFQCPAFANITTGCEYFGRIFKEGDEITTGNDCEICRCAIGGEISCAFIECPGSVFGAPPYPSKYADPSARDAEFEAKYKHCYYSDGKSGSCCAKPECPTAEQYASLKRCNYNNRTLLPGQAYYLDERCKKCSCSDDFDESNPGSSSTCHDVGCSYDFGKIKRGCTPVFFKNGCCPISYECPPPSKEERDKICAQPAEVVRCSRALITLYTFNSTTKQCQSYDSYGCASSRNNFETLEDCERFCVKPDQPIPLYSNDEPKCEFGRERYDIGTKFNAGQSICECIVPPMPTCKSKH